MPPTPLPDGSVRPSAVVNAAIRALIDAGGQGSAVHVQLLEEWAAARRAEAELAA